MLKSKFCHSSQNLLNFASQNNSSAIFFLITAQKHMKFFSFSQFSYQMQRVESKRVLYLCKLFREQLWQMKWGKIQPYCPLMIWKQTNKQTNKGKAWNDSFFKMSFSRRIMSWNLKCNFTLNRYRVACLRRKYSKLLICLFTNKSFQINRIWQNWQC